jgi:hypothetical protein
MLSIVVVGIASFSTVIVGIASLPHLWRTYWSEAVHKPTLQQEQGGDTERQHLRFLHAQMADAELQPRANRSLIASQLWLRSTIRVDAHLQAMAAPLDIQGYTLSEIQRIALHHFPWNGLMSDKDLLQEVAPALAASMLMHDEVSTCCSSSSCLHDQVHTAMIFEELEMADLASTHLQAAKAAVITNGGSPSCRSMVWQRDRLMAPLDNHFPLGYEHLVDGASEPAFWSSSHLPLVQFLEQFSQEIVAELAPLCLSDPLTATAHFGSERVARNLAHGSWTSLPLLDNGMWNASACESLAPRTCSLLKKRPELEGALRSASAADTVVQFTFVSVYRLRPKSRIHRHVGTPWRLNTHLGLVTPPGAHIQVWNETREWEVGKAFAFMDAAEHHVTHKGSMDRCVLNVVSWHPSVLERRLADPVFAENFIFQKAWSSITDIRFQDA